MNDLTIKTPTIRVPGLLSDDAMQEQLKIFKDGTGAQPLPASAVDLADRVQSQFFDAPIKNSLRLAAPVAGPVGPALNLLASASPDAMVAGAAPQKVTADPQERATEVRSDILSESGVGKIIPYITGGIWGVGATEGGFLSNLGTLSPEESKAGQEANVQQATAAEQRARRLAETHAKLRALTDEQATAMGLPIAPGGLDAQTAAELKANGEALDQRRVAEATKSRVDAETNAPTQTWWLNAIRSYSKGMTEGFTGIGKGAAIGLAELPGELSGLRDPGRSDLRAWFDTVDKTMNKLMPADASRREDFDTVLASGGGSMTSFLVASVVASAIGLPAKAATTIVGAATGASQQYEDAEQHHANALERLGSFLFGGALGATEAIPINRAFGRLEKMTGGVVSRALAGSAASGMEEFVQELGQNIGQDVVAKVLYDEQRKMDPRKYLKAAAAGGILGMMGGTALSTLQHTGIIPGLHEEQGADGEKVAAQRDAETAKQEDILQRVLVGAQFKFNELMASQEGGLEGVAAQTGEQTASPDNTAVGPQNAAQENVAAQQADQQNAVLEPTTSEADPQTNSDVGTVTPPAEQPPAVTGTVDAYTLPEFSAALASSKPISALPSSASLNTPSVPTAAVMADKSRVESVPLASVRSTQPRMEWDRFNAGDYGEPLVKGYEDKPIAVRKEDGEYLVYDGHHRTVNAINSGETSMDMYVVDAKAYDPANAGRRASESATSKDDTDALLKELLASTSSGRGTYKGEQQRNPTAGVTSGADDNVSLRQIANNFGQLLNLTVRQGRFTLKGADVMGQYSTRSGVIRLRSPNDLSSLVHEGAHALEQAADGQLRTFIKSNSTYLATVAQHLYGGDVSSMSQGQKVSEGFAEFFRVFALNRAFARANYPSLTGDFETLLAQHNPELGNGLQLIGDQYAAWLQLPSAQLVRNMIQSGRETTGINAKIKEARSEGLVNWFSEWVNGVHTAALNQYNNLNRLVADVLNVADSNNKSIDLKRADDPRVLIRLATNSGNRAMIQLTDGVMGHRSTTSQSASLRDVLLRYHGLNPDQQLGAIDAERQKDFAAYVVALRGIDEYDRLSQGKISRPPLAATLGDLTLTAKEMEAKYGSDFKTAAGMLHDYSMALWTKAHDAGLLADETYDDGMTRGYYVPLQRDMSDKQGTQSSISASATARGASIVKRFKGSDRDIIDPMDALMQKTFALEKVIAENEVKVALAKLADKAGTVGSLVERVPARQLLGEQYSVEDIARQLTKDPTMTATDAADLMNLLEAAIDQGNHIAMFRSKQAMAGGENVVFFWESGKLAALQIKDGDVGSDIINTLNAVGTETVPLLVDLIAYPSSVFRAAVTSWPDFLLVNFIRDQMSAFVLTDGYKPFVTGLRGVGDEIRQKTWAREYNAAMGTMGGMNSSTLHQARVDRDISALRKKGYIAQVFRDKSIAGAARGLARVTELTETGTRLGIYRTTYDRAIKDGLTPWESSVEAAYVATDYIDFGLHGNRMMAWRRLVPFLNAQLQGLNKMVRTLAGDEVRQRKGLMYSVSAFFKDVNNLPLTRAERNAVVTGRKAWMKMASLGIIGAALQAVFADDPDYQDASEYLRTTGWVIPIGGGQIIYVPKPFELAMVSNFVERGMEMASGDKEAKNRMLRGMAMNLLPPTNPPAIQTLVEQMANWQSFSGREIVPDYMRALEPELQYNHYTTEFAKTLGSAFGWSPMRIDHIMNSFGASAYRDLTGMYNMTDPSRPSSDVTDWPITRRFVRDARQGAVSAQDFWKVASTVTGSLRRAELTYRTYIESGKERAAENYLDELGDDEKAYALLNTHFKADFKKLNPTYRTRQLTTIVSAMRRELYSDLGVENSMKGMATEPIMLSAKEKADVDNLLSEYARREVRNSLVYSKVSGWENKKPLDTESTIDILRATQPQIAEEFERRVHKAKVYDARTVQEYWPEVRDRLIKDRDQAFLKDIQAVAKAMRP